MKKNIYSALAMTAVMVTSLVVASCNGDTIDDITPSGGGTKPAQQVRKVKSVQKVYSLELGEDLAKTTRATVTYVDGNNQVKQATINGTTWSYKGTKSDMQKTDMGMSVEFEPGTIPSQQYYDVGYNLKMDYEVTYTDGSTETVNAIQANPQTEDVKGQYLDQALDAASMGTVVYIAIRDSSKIEHLTNGIPVNFETNAYHSRYEGVEDQVTPMQTYNATDSKDDEYVDLDLPSGLHWCSHNVGATTPSELGGLYGWGDATGFQIDPNPYYYYTNRPTLESISGTRYDICQTMDCSSRMPTREEWEEMLDGTTAEMGQLNGQPGQWRISKKNKQHRIFLPESGTRRGSNTSRGTSSENWYWTASLYTNDKQAAYAMRFTHSGNTYKPVFHERFYGAAVRAVKSASAATMPSNNTLGNNPTQALPDAPADMQLVDLGLSVKWANMNWGSKDIYDPGKYYAWGELQPKEVYSDKNYAWPVSMAWNGSQPYESIPTRLYEISNSWSYDVAYHESNGRYAMPTAAQLRELIEACNMTWYNRGNMEFRGTAGAKFARKDNPSVYIFIPATGYMFDDDLCSPYDVTYVWTGSIQKDKNGGYAFAYNLYADENTLDNNKPRALTSAFYRYAGVAIRPVEARLVVN